MTSLTLEQQAYYMCFIARIDGLRRAMRRFPISLLEFGMRLAVGATFFRSGMNKVEDFNNAIVLFRDEYRLPLIPPEIAAYVAASIELSTPVLLVLGLFTRAAAFVLLGMTTVIEVFVYPEAWPTHIQWAAMLLVLLCRGAGTLSLDEPIYLRMLRRN